MKTLSHRFVGGFLSRALVAGLLLAAPTASAASELGWRAQLDAMLVEYQRQGSAPGLSAVVVQGGRIVFSAGYGVERAGEPTPMSADSSVGVGSLTKSFTALAVMQLVEQGRLQLDAPVQRYLPWFQTADPACSEQMTLRMLLSNSSGLPSQDASWIWDTDTDSAAIERGVRALRSYQCRRAPGLSFEYSNEGFNVLGVVIEQVSGLSYPDYLNARVLGPLGMKRSSTALEDFSRIGALHGHWPDLQRAVAAPAFYQAIAMPAGSMLHASANDLGRYLIALLGGGTLDGQQLLQPPSVERLWTPVIHAPGLAVEEGGNGDDIGYGLGWMISTIEGRTIVHHAGASYSSASETLIDPATGSAVSLLINTEPGDRYRYRPLPWLANNILHLVNGEPPSSFALPRRSDPSSNRFRISATEAQRYLGSYLGKVGRIDIDRGGGEGLVATYTMGPYRQRLEVDFVNPVKVVLRSFARTCSGHFQLSEDGEPFALQVTGVLQGNFGKLRSRRGDRQSVESPDGRVAFGLPASWRVRWHGQGFVAAPSDGERHDDGVAEIQGGVGRQDYAQWRAQIHGPILAEHVEPVAGRLWRQAIWDEADGHGGQRRRLLYWTAHAGGGFAFILQAPPAQASAVVREVAMPLIRELRL
ncbi:MAG: serine hydrolase domain-containing protein [Pseudomonadota bacterium]